MRWSDCKAWHRLSGWMFGFQFNGNILIVSDSSLIRIKPSNAARKPCVQCFRTIVMSRFTSVLEPQLEKGRDRKMVKNRLTQFFGFFLFIMSNKLFFNHALNVKDMWLWIYIYGILSRNGKQNSKCSRILLKGTFSRQSWTHNFWTYKYFILKLKW